MNWRKRLKSIVVILIVVIVTGLLLPTWTPKIRGENSISELRKVEINGEDIQIMIRGCDRNNPILLFVHGGPCWSEIPYVVKYQKEWEEKFTIVHYDQRGSGKSFRFFEDYSNVSSDTHVDDLIKLTEYILGYLEKDRVILLGHSYGTYIATIAAAAKPELYRAYVGIGQKAYPIEGELCNLESCILAAQNAGNTRDVVKLETMRELIENGDMIVPRNYVRKYGFAARTINDNADYLEGFLFRPEYNLLDTLRLYTAAFKYQDALLAETMDNPLSDIVTEVKIPFYFLMGKYDCMTSPKAAQTYLDNLISQQEKEFVIFENSAHFPQFEERDVFYEWLCEKFLGEE